DRRLRVRVRLLPAGLPAGGPPGRPQRLLHPHRPAHRLPARRRRAPLNVLNQTMDQLLEVIAGRLRRGDVVSRFSGAQYVLMLPGATQVVSPMNKKIPLAAAVLLCLACLVLGGGLAFLWLGGGTPPQAPQLPVSTPA